MEAEGALVLWRGYVLRLNLRYFNVVSDSDSTIIRYHNDKKPHEAGVEINQV